MKLKHALLLSSILALTACGGSHRPVYSGHEESTAGLPGFDAKGKKLNPHVKLGQSYSVDGETYVPKYEPGYVQEGMASWYGPGFHGGKTANGERYDSSEMTAAHRTLPLPSMVRVTLLKTGQSAIVRINDRGPYAHGRIIDLSKASADAIGLTKMGTGKVRVEYLDQETRRFTTLMADGRNPKDIDVNEEVLAFLDKQRNATTAMTDVADATDQLPTGSPSGSVFDLAQDNTARAGQAVGNNTNDSWLSRMNPIGSAHAEQPIRPLANAESVTSADLPPAELPAGNAQPIVEPAPAPQFVPAAGSASRGPIIVPKNAAVNVVPKNTVVNVAPVTAKPPVVIAASGGYIQLGAFASKGNADALAGKVVDVGTPTVSASTIDNGQSIYRVRLGPYADADNLAKALAKLQARGLDAKPIYE